MMIAIVILGLGLVMTATMFPVAWTRARTLTEYTTQRAISQSAAATIAETVRPSGSTFTAFVAGGAQTGKYFLSSGGLAGDLFFDPVLHSDPDPSTRLPCNGPGSAQCWTHLSVLIPSDTRVHALNMENLSAVSPNFSSTATGRPPAENPFAIERINMQGGARVDLCDLSRIPAECITGYPLSDYPLQCAKPNYAGEPNGAQFCARSFYSPQVGVGARMYPPLENPPSDPSAQVAFNAWLDKFNNRRFAWAALHRLRSPVGPTNVPPPPGALPATESVLLASQAAQAAGTTRVFDFYIVMLKRPQPTSRYAMQNPDPTLVPDWNAPAPAAIAPADVNVQPDVALPVAWRVQLEIPATLATKYGGAATGVPTEIQVPPTGLSGASVAMVIGMFPAGTQFVDEINGQVYRVTRRRLNFDATGNPTTAILTLDRELLLEDFDNSPQFGGDGVLQPLDVRRIVWVFPPPIAERTSSTSVTFENSSPVVGIDVKTISLTPPG